MIDAVAPQTPAQKRQTKRAQNLEARNAKIRDGFTERYTKQERPRKYTREYVISQLALEYFLSMDTVEDIIYQK